MQKLYRFIEYITSYNWPFYIVTVRLLYPTVLHHYTIICCNTVTKLFHLKCFSFSTYIKCFVNDVISAATFQGCRADILAARWYSVIHSTLAKFIKLTRLSVSSLWPIMTRSPTTSDQQDPETWSSVSLKRRTLVLKLCHDCTDETQIQCHECHYAESHYTKLIDVECVDV
jgi:hypothetical protein